MSSKSAGKAREAVAAEAAGRYRAPALDKGLDILELLAGTDESHSQAEIAKALGRSPSEIYRMLDRLVRRGYVRRVAGDRYELSLKLFALSHQHAPLRRLVSQAVPPMRRFARNANQSCHLAVYDRGGVTVVAQIDSPTYWGLSIRVGARVSLFNTGPGHVLLAFRAERERAFMLAEREAHAGDEAVPRGLEERLAAIRRKGHEVMASLQTEGVQDLSVPVLGPDGSAVAALTCPFLRPVERGAAPDLIQALTLIKETGRELSALVGGAPPAGGPPRD
ncbi:MAG: IclR family transcriptional regulator [Rhodospirillaceae bacterium]|nr:IclR family transcriptional regulator [Rhodospirillaceae bacterium]